MQDQLNRMFAEGDLGRHNRLKIAFVMQQRVFESWIVLRMVFKGIAQGFNGSSTIGDRERRQAARRSADLRAALPGRDPWALQ